MHCDELEIQPINKWHNLEKHFKYNNNNNNDDCVNKCTQINLVRNPYTRVVSMYTNKFCGKIETAILSQKIKLEKNTFKNFVEHLYSLKQQNNWIDCHILPQSRTYDDSNINIKLENFENDILNVYSDNKFANLLPKVNFFLEKMKTNSDDIDMNVTKKKYDEYSFIGLTEFEQNYDDVWYDYKCFYNDEIANIVYETYKDDFILYGYSKDWNEI